jgi:protein phosphatase
VHWFYEMTRLWEAFEPWHCRQSLLDLENICLDEDEALAIKRLYFTPEKTFTVQDLAKVWQALFKQSQRTQFGSLVQLLSDLDEGVIQTLPDLRSRLENIAQELQAEPTTDTPTMESMSEPQAQKTSSPTILQSSEDFTSKSDDMPTVVLPMELANLEDVGRTDVGRQRQHNEDCFGIETKINKVELLNNRDFRAHGLYILCDGMGGHAGGEIASSLAVKTLRQYFQANWVADQLPSEASIREAVRLANQAIYDVNQHDSRSGVARMGTTLVLLLVQDNQVAIAHVGDSRLYRLTRKGGIQQLTVDHEVGQREILRGVEPSIAYARPDAYQLTQALGPRDENFINPDVQFLELSEDTLLILASDGLTDNDLVEQHWRTHLEPLLSSRANLEAGVNELIDLANQYNGHDNITAVLVRAKVRPNLEQQ